jgi:hypothetical protein
MSKCKKTDIVKLNTSTLKPIEDSAVIRVFRGTEQGHYYVPYAVTDDGINICARALNEDVSSSMPEDGIETRVRVIPVNAEKLSANKEAFLSSLGVEIRTAGGFAGPGIHYSQVTKNPAGLVDAIFAGLEYLS